MSFQTPTVVVFPLQAKCIHLTSQTRGICDGGPTGEEVLKTIQQSLSQMLPISFKAIKKPACSLTPSDALPKVIHFLPSFACHLKRGDGEMPSKPTTMQILLGGLCFKTELEEIKSFCASQASALFQAFWPKPARTNLNSDNFQANCSLRT